MNVDRGTVVRHEADVGVALLGQVLQTNPPVENCELFRNPQDNYRDFHHIQVSGPELGTFGIFEFFSTIKNHFFAFFIKLIRLGVGFLNMTGAEVGN